MPNPTIQRNKPPRSVAEYLDVEAEEDDDEVEMGDENLDEFEPDFIDDSGVNDDSNETAIHWEASPAPEGDGAKDDGSAEDDDDDEDYVVQRPKLKRLNTRGYEGSSANRTKGIPSKSVAPGDAKPGKQTRLQVEPADKQKTVFTLTEDEFSAFERFKASEEKKKFAKFCSWRFDRKAAAARIKNKQPARNTRSVAKVENSDDSRSSGTLASENLGKQDKPIESKDKKQPTLPPPDLAKFNANKSGTTHSDADIKTKSKRKRGESDTEDTPQVIKPDLSQFNAKKTGTDTAPANKKSKNASKKMPVDSAKQEQVARSVKAGEVVLETKNARKPRPSPEVCEVMDPDVQDPMLKPVYEAGLPKLESVLSFGIRGHFIAWNQKRGPGMFLPSDLGTINPAINIGTVWSFLNFVSKGRFVNLARIAPEELEATYLIMGNEDKRWTLSYNGNAAYCLTVAIITSSSLTEVASDSGNSGLTVPLSKHVLARFPCQEFDRVASMCSMVFSQKTLHAQLNEDSLTIGTRTVTGKKLKEETKAWPSGGIRSASSSYKSSYINADALPHTADVPVYDGRNGTLNADDVLGDLNHLARYDKRSGEIEENSCAVVCYTVTQYHSRAKDNKPDEERVSFNIQWVMVIGEPE
ncbi:hypothetical protein B0H12DRAFT_1078862 [Mycena haematopus]|nr:hypothetical protein B0H12DRAFT_1078862 [Mycena haematopus]